MLKNRINLILTLFILSLIYSCGNQQEIITKRLNYTVKNEEVYNFFEVQEDGVSFYENLNDKKSKKQDFKIYFNETKDFENLCYWLDKDSLEKIIKKKGNDKFSKILNRKIKSKPKSFIYNEKSKFPLKGCRIAIDPGHVAGSFKEARMEGKCMSIKNRDGSKTQLYEAKLNFATALFLKDTLVKLGAEVFLTKNKHGHTAFDKTYSQWYRENMPKAIWDRVKQGTLSQQRAKKLFKSYQKNDTSWIFHKVFIYSDMHKRAEEINAFRPHLSIILHCNVDEGNSYQKDEDGDFKSVDYNYNMVFVPGSFMKGELKRLSARIEFARMLFTPDIENSIQLSNKVMKNFTSHLNVPPVEDNERLNYIKRGCLKVGDAGVYARNLALTRLIRGTICFGETFCQDHYEESKRLAKDDDEINGWKVPKRMRQAAMAYFSGIMEYLKTSKEIR